MEATILEAADQVAGVMAGGLGTVTAAVLIGRTLLGSLRPVRGRLTQFEGWLLSYCCGAALLSAVVFWLCSLHLVYDATLPAILVVAWLCWRRWGRWAWLPLDEAQSGLKRPWLAMLLIPSAVYGALYVVHTLAPETRTDAMGYHLGLVQRYYRAHGFEPITTNVYAHISQGAEMLYLLAYTIGREAAAKVVHFVFLVAATGMLLTLAQRFRAATAGVFAAVVLFTCPVVIPDATSAYNDCALACAILAAFYLLVLWRRHGHREWLVLLGLMIGFSFSVKYTGVVAVAAAVPVAVAGANGKQGWRRALARLVCAGVPAAALGLPWLAKSAIVTGNPLAPFFNRWFPTPHISVEWEEAYRFAMRAYREGPFSRIEQLVQAPFDLVLGERYAGSVGWMALLIPIALLGWRRPAVRALLAAGLVAALPWTANAGARFLIPCLPFFLLAVGITLQALPSRARLATVAVLLAGQCVTSWPADRDRWYYAGLWSVEGFPWRAALRVEPQKWHLARNVESFLVADRIDQIGDERTRVLSTANLPEAYFRAELLVSFQGLENQELTEALIAPLGGGNGPSLALKTQWPEAEIRGVRIEQAREHRARYWTVSEVRLLLGGERIAPTSGWRSEAEPHPWYAGRLLDGDVFSAWSSHERPRPGMWIEVRLPSAELCDGLELVHLENSAATQTTLEVELLTPDGAWVPAQRTDTEFVDVPYDPQDGRDWAADKLRRHGIGFVVLSDHPRKPYWRASRAIAGDPASWGLRKVFVDRSAMLFEVLPVTGRTRGKPKADDRGGT